MTVTSRLQPAIIPHNNQTVHQYRGLKYGKVSRRFAEPEAVTLHEIASQIDCTQFGPICPQVSIDFHHLLRVPESLRSQEPVVTYNEFDCLNLDITVPVTTIEKLPVMVWIHGGSQSTTFMPASSPCADVVPFVTAALRHEKPVIIVFVNYRLNIFAFGNGKSTKNLALKDQRLAIEWVHKHIEGFGGDPANITIAGESAGAVYVHAHVLTGAPVRRAILQSGSLYLSPPQAEERGQMLCERLETALHRDGHSLIDAPVHALLNSLVQANAVSFWLQMTDELQCWRSDCGRVENLLIGDVEYESAIWRNGVECLTAPEIVQCFDLAGDRAGSLKKAYSIVADRPTACKLGALDFISDTRFALPVLEIRDLFLQAGRSVHAYTFDQANPWQQSSRAHHTVDLIMLFGDLDFTHDPGASSVRDMMREKWMEFCHGEEPWPSREPYAFGPYGRCSTISEDEYAGRRRLQACRILREIGPETRDLICSRLAAGRMSLLN